MRAEDAALVAALCRSRAGLRHAPAKAYLVESRLGTLARRMSFESVADLLAAIRTAREEPLIWAMVEAMAAGETAFFRDREPFRLFGEAVIPRLSRARAGRPIRVWSAACATGQEIYSLAMIADELAAADPAVRVELAASDLSAYALERAQSGLYNQFEVQRGLPIRRLVRYFEKAGEDWRLVDAIRKKVRWRRINLIAGVRAVGRFDVVFCRYVLSAMTEEAQRKVLEDLTFVLPEDGYLVLGKDEVVPAAAEIFQPAPGQPGFYTQNPAFRAAA